MVDQQGPVGDRTAKILTGGLIAAIAAFGLYKFYRCLRSCPTNKINDDYFNDLEWKIHGGEIKRVLVLGLDGAGKTQLIRSFRNTAVGRPLPRVDPTLDFNIQFARIGGYDLRMYDVPGRLIRPMSSRDWNINFFEWDCFDVIVWAVDSTDRARFQEAKEALHSCLSNPDVFGIPVILVATKQDLYSAASQEDVLQAMSVGRYWWNHSVNIVSTYVSPFDERKGIRRLYELICTVEPLISSRPWESLYLVP